MDPNRENELLRALAKDNVRDGGIRFRDDMCRKAGVNVKEFNEHHRLSVPLTVKEYLEMYLAVARELANEYFAAIEAKVASLAAGEEEEKRIGFGAKPQKPLIGPAFQEGDGQKPG